MSFVKLENLNDFIQPSSSCIKPIDRKTPGVVAKVKDINLSDCLACSGCITSAESVLVQEQNCDELFKVINENKNSKLTREIVVSLSLQSISSLAHKFSMSAQETAERMASFLVSIGCHKIYDINLARHLALVESHREFKSQRRANTKLPIISSICPGWICYAEKTNGDLIIPHLSRVRSPQQIMGSLLKRNHTVGDVAKQKAGIFHVTLMPCFDKKLEASRDDFRDTSDDSQDVDCVLTPIEFEDLLNSEGVTLKDFEPRKLDTLIECGQQFDQPLTSHFGSVSGGYAENILLAEAMDCLGANMPEDLRKNLEYSSLKNSDFIEVNLRLSSPDTDSVKLPKVAIINGFRNIQTVVQRLKRKALKYDYIEIMACPSGCINGGGQLRPEPGETQTTTIEGAKRVYKEVPSVQVDSGAPTGSQLYDKLVLTDELKRDKLLYTEFHPVPKMQNLTVNW